MPVLFKGRSEYSRHYKWNPSYRSASFSPKSDQLASDAGLRSDEIISSLEPRISAKKKVWHREPQVQSCLLWWPESGTEDGSSYETEASAPGKNGDGSPVMKAYRKKERENKMPPRRKAVDKRRSRSLDGSITLEREAVKGQTTSDQNRVGNKSRPKVIEKHHQRKKASEEESLRMVRKASSPKKNTRSDATKCPPENVATKRSSPKVMKAPNKSTGHDSDEAQRKNPKKSRQSLANIPLQHKAGLNAGKPQRLSKARLTEYQRNFAPKVPAKPSPILSAVDVVHSSSPAIPPHSGMKFQPTSEYLAKFRGAVSPSKPAELSAKMQTAPASPSMKLKVKDIQKPFFAAAKKKVAKSEYTSQFEASTEFEVGKLREMAENNKQRHQGTHIDPEHATQIASPYNKCWEASSDGSSMRNAPSDTEKNVNTPSESEETPEDQWSKASQKGSDSTTLAEEDKETEVEADSLEGDSASRDSVVKRLDMDEEEPKSDDELDSKISLDGRLPTPRLQDMGGALRTHHDLTTPSKGGALLISSHGRRGVESGGSYISSKTSTQFSPVAGSPTHDEQKLFKGREHALVRSSPCQIPSQQTPKASRRSSARTPEKHRPSYTKEPQIKKESPSKRPLTGSPSTARHATPLTSVRAPIRGSLKNQEFQHCGPTGRVQTAPASLWVSNDALSAASSVTSARASDLLSRAKARKSFWTTA